MYFAGAINRIGCRYGGEGIYERFCPSAGIIHVTNRFCAAGDERFPKEESYRSSLERTPIEERRYWVFEFGEYGPEHPCQLRESSC